MTGTVSQVKASAGETVQQSLQSQKMRLGKVINMDIIPDACAILGGIIISKNIYGFSFSQRCFKDERYKMGFRGVVLTQFTVRISACGIKIAK